MPRRFPTPWSIDERDACFIMKDASGQAVAYVYCEDDAGRRTTQNYSREMKPGELLKHNQAAGSVARRTETASEYCCGRKVD